MKKMRDTRIILPILITLILALLAGCRGADVDEWDIVIPDTGGRETQDEIADDEYGQAAHDEEDDIDEIVDPGELGDQGDPGDPGEKTTMIGIWQDTPSLGSVDGQRHHFYENGDYIFEYSQYDEAKRVLSENGTWDFRNGKLTLAITGMTTVEGGEKGEPMFFSEYAIVNGTIRIKQVDPPKESEYILEDFYYDMEGSPGRLTVVIGDTRYWKYADDPDYYLNNPVKDGDTYPAG